LKHAFIATCQLQQSCNNPIRSTEAPLLKVLYPHSFKTSQAKQESQKGGNCGEKSDHPNIHEE
jgi:hypothetical protein